MEKLNTDNKAVLVYNILNIGTAQCLRESFSARSVNENQYNLRNYIEERCYGTVYRVKLKLLNRLMRGGGGRGERTL